MKYVILHRIYVVNWVPTNHTSTIASGLGKFIYVVSKRKDFDFGAYIFNQIMKQAFSSAVKIPICFPSLFCGIILKQHPGILLVVASVKKRESRLTLHYKLFGGAHVIDIVLTSSQVPGPITSKKGIIAPLKETYSELDNSIGISTASKIKLESLIKALLEEEGNQDGATSVAEGDESGGDDVAENNELGGDDVSDQNASEGENAYENVVNADTNKSDDENVASDGDDVDGEGEDYEAANGVDT